MVSLGAAVVGAVVGSVTVVGVAGASTSGAVCVVSLVPIILFFTLCKKFVAEQLARKSDAMTTAIESFFIVKIRK